MNYVLEIIFALVTVFVGLVAYCSYVYELKPKESLDKLKNEKLLIILEIVLSLFVLIVLNLMFHVNMSNYFKIQSLLSILIPIAVIDWYKHIIPNKLLIVLLVERVVCVALDFMMGLQDAEWYALGCLITAAIIYVLFLAMQLITKNGIGGGDVKIFAIVGLYLNAYGGIQCLLYSFIVSFFVSVFLLLTKKKNRKDELAFGPILLVGLLIKIVLMGA